MKNVFNEATRNENKKENSASWHRMGDSLSCEIQLKEGKKLSLLDEEVNFEIKLIFTNQEKGKETEKIDLKKLKSISLYSVLDIIHHKEKHLAEIIELKIIEEKDESVSFELKSNLKIHGDDNLLLNVGTLNFDFSSLISGGGGVEEAVVVMQIVKEKGVFYKNIAL